MTTPDAAGRPPTDRDRCFEVLSNTSCRTLARLVVAESPAGIEKHELASRFAAVTNDIEPDSVTDDQIQRALLECHHRGVPALVDAGLVTVDDETVRATDHWAYDDPGFSAPITGRTNHSAEELDVLFEALADARRRAALSILTKRYRPTTVRSLAHEVASLESGVAHQEDAKTHVERVQTALTHVHVPILSTAGLVEYDADADRVSFAGHPVLDVAWLEPDSSSGDSNAGAVSFLSKPSDV
ncbi:DUF7344 domain-containing protein [Natrarchaeobaculum sulfurireducens]|uniref:Transcriptional regulator, ArsR family n=1 Tax=Natrarchaeobaculum sulfurireducens TaxID=2044521 RepID=A0A346PQV7_9EURY|nr:hypothetical protein [Natrarchaeobaculum sulfurireducens]AXR78109.1 Transcriptional regulator, ArsR family [Natrarchaeobaculum sulfurireducens]AXR81902.1 hypothetical protein AArcMg_1895 [Natrarchaeobaculum sulfurireducens]